MYPELEDKETKNKDRHAFPCLDHDYIQTGLTKREYFAGQAMQGLLANPELGNRDEKMLSIMSLTHADALLKALQS